MTNPNPSFWQNKRVLVTGHSGFKGSWMVVWLKQMGAEVCGVSLPPHTNPDLFTLAGIEELCEENHFCDIRDAKLLEKIMVAFQPELVFHLAAQALVRASYADPLATFATNVMGTAHVLEAIRQSPSVKVALLITTDKVYQNREWIWPYREEDPLGGHDPYSASKAASELVIESYHRSFLQDQTKAIASARAGNVIGGGDWSTDRLIPDAIRAWQNKETLHIRHPEAIRPWQHVLEPLSGYLLLAEKLWQQPEQTGAYNFGPLPSEAATVREVIDLASTSFVGAKVRFDQPNESSLHEAKWLALETAKAKHTLNYEPRWGLSASVGRTIDWYQKQYQGADARQLCLQDIENFIHLA